MQDKIIERTVEEDLLVIGKERRLVEGFAREVMLGFEVYRGVEVQTWMQVRPLEREVWK